MNRKLSTYGLFIATAMISQPTVNVGHQPNPPQSIPSYVNKKCKSCIDFSECTSSVCVGPLTKACTKYKPRKGRK